MASIRDLLINRTIHYVEPQQTVLEAATYMVEANVGAAPVLDGSRLAGIFFERDIMSKLVTRGLDPENHPHLGINDYHASNAGTRCLLRRSVAHDANPWRPWRTALPVCDGNTLVGFLSLSDLIRHTLEEKSGEAEVMRAYIQTSVS